MTKSTDIRAIELDAQAIEILRGNDCGTYTVPTKGLYPYQWNWDSIFVALGFSAFDIDRAWVEIDTLLADQWPDGMVPHIIFRKVDPGYFPGPDQWQTNRQPPTSGITQPPVAATVVRQLLEIDRDLNRDRAERIMVALDRWHQWFATARDPKGRGIVAISHPWESGRDNLPDWDRPLSFVDTSGVAEYQRRDTQHVDADQRPTKADYDRYLALVQFGREHNWNIEAIANGNAFWVADVGMNAILLRAEHDLAAIAARLGNKTLAKRAEQRATRLENGMEALWCEALGGYASLDLRRNEHAKTLSSGIFLPLYAGAVSQERAERLIGLLVDWLDAVRFGVPSFDPHSDQFDAIRYWRGPVWAMINWMIAMGLNRHNRPDLADRLRRDTQDLVENSGFSENFSPITGRGCGGDEFSWTAAIWLAWASPTHKRATA